MIRVASGSRLHFGVFSFGDGPGERFFGGAGMMIEAPTVRVAVQRARAWSAQGARSERALDFAQKLAASFDAETIPPHALHVEAMPPEHAGLGSGTQLGLAVARALAESVGMKNANAEELAVRVARGQRSALGIHGFTQGGFLVEAGKQDRETVSPLVARMDFPEDWRLVLAIPSAEAGLHGPAEIEAFRRLHTSGVSLPTDHLCRLVLLGMLPALATRDLPAFADALFEFNRKVGEAFAAVQGGPYAGPRVTAIVEWLRRHGVRGVAQSSWGPAVCGVVRDEDEAGRLTKLLADSELVSPSEVWATRARNGGAEIQA